MTCPKEWEGRSLPPLQNNIRICLRSLQKVGDVVAQTIKTKHVHGLTTDGPTRWCTGLQFVVVVQGFSLFYFMCYSSKHEGRSAAEGLQSDPEGTCLIRAP